MIKFENIIITKSFAIAVRIVNLYKLLAGNNEYILSKRLLRSRTSIGANVREVHIEESKNDFIHKMGISQKETSETPYWLEFMRATEYLHETEFQSIMTDATELLKIIRSIILTSKQNKNLNIQAND